MSRRSTDRAYAVLSELGRGRPRVAGVIVGGPVAARLSAGDE